MTTKENNPFTTFAFVGDLVDFNGVNKIDITPDIQLAKARGETRNLIKKQLGKGIHHPLQHYCLYEVDYIVSRENGRIQSMNYRPLATKNWNYTIINHNLPPIGNNLPLIFGLSRLDLTIILQSGIPNIGVGGLTYNTVLMSNFYQDSMLNIMLPQKKIMASDILELQKIKNDITIFSKIKNNFPNLQKALEDFDKLNYISILSPFKILSYFSVIELLLTSFNNNNRVSKTIKEQLKSKISLINNQLETPINVSDYFSGPDTLSMFNIIGKLYEYRNDIAHGNKSDFENSLQLLKGNDGFIRNFLREVVKKLILFSISNPQMISDLKKC